MKRKYTFERPGRAARFFGTRKGRLVLFAGVIAALAAVALLIIYVFVPLFTPPEQTEETETHAHLRKNRFRDSLSADAEADGFSYNLSKGVTEAKLGVLTAIDPFIFEDEIIFVSSATENGLLKYNKLFIYDCNEKKETQVDVETKYTNILYPRFNDDYIVFLDSSAAGGGRICVYDRKNGKQFTVKDYLYAAPKIAMCGNVIVFYQQAGEATDRLYFYDLETGESSAYRVLSGLPIAPPPVSAKDGKVVYSVPYSTEDGFGRSRIYKLDLDTGHETVIEPGKLIYDIKTDGENIAFLASAAGMPTDLYLLDGEIPDLIAEDAANFEMGNGFIAYTKDDAVYAYSLRERIHYKVNSDISRAYLASANGDRICFMDVTGGFDDNVNTIKYIKVDIADG